MSKIQGNGKFYFQKACVILLMVSAVVFTLAMRAEAVNSVRGQVVNAVSGKPIAGVTVEISIADVKQSTEPVLTDENGRFEFPDLGDLQPPYRLDFTKRKYKAKTIQPVDSGADLSVQLEPGNIQRPFKPLVFSGPRSVRITWDANPEYNIAGYNIYRKSGTNNVWERLNNPNSKPYEGYMKELEYVDEQIQVGVMYQYAIQAVSDVDRYTGLSDASDWVQGEYLTVFFPEKVTYKEENLYLWEKDPQNPQEWQIRIPVCSKSVYDVSATSIQIDSELPGGLIIDPKSITVEPSGITAGMMMGANAIVNENKINVRIAAAGVEAESLYGSGILFNIIAKPNRSLIDECGLLHLIPDDGGGNGVRLYDVISDMTSPIKELLLRDGQLCVTGSCVHGDANNDGIVDEQDARYVLAYWVKKVQGNNCFPGSADINLDGLVDSADSSLILRWLEGKSITPPKIKADVKSTGDYIAGLKMLADGGSMSAQAQLASLQKENVGVKVWFRGTLEGSAGSDKWIAIVADEVSNAAGFEFVLNYDPEFAEIKQIKPVTAANIWRWDYAVYQTETGSTSARITGASDENLGITGEVELVKVKFKIKRTGKGDIKFVQVQIHDKYGHTPRFDDPLAPKILDPEPVEVEGEGEPTEGEGIIEGAIEGVPEGFPEGVVEGEGEGSIENVSVPNVIGKPVEEASGIIQEASLSVGAIIGICTNDFPPGTVVDQIPSGGNTVDIGTIVDLLISCGPCVTIPDVVNLNVDMAEQEILGAGLRVGEIIEVCNDNAPAGLVMAQEPAAIEYSCIGINTEEVSVDLWVSSGPCTVNELTITQEVTGAGVIGNNYIPGNNATVRVTFNNETGSLIYALGLTCVLPAGWQYQGGDNQPPIAPAVGTVSDGVNPLEFVWIYVPSFPLILEFNVSIPSGAEGPCSIQTQGLYRTFSSGQLYTNIATTDFAGAIVQEGTPEGVIEGAVEGPPEGVVEGTPEGVVEGTPEGVVEGMPEGVIEGVPEGVVEGIPE
ncbi:MAG TPA: PASTA domain-containing protein, partial [Candidatus Hydrogenedens sp.]|nr:PASTA domain-containing protein [Candidatus Hydrogenedens sp.]